MTHKILNLLQINILYYGITIAYYFVKPAIGICSIDMGVSGEREVAVILKLRGA